MRKSAHRSIRLRTPARWAVQALLCASCPTPVHAEDAKGKARVQSITRYHLPQLIALARKTYPGMRAAKHALDAMRAQAFRAKWGWAPQGQMRGLLAPAPEIRCQNADGDPDTDLCIRTAQVDASSINISGVMAQIGLELGIPVYTFDKLGSARRAAHAGLQAGRAQLATASADLALKVAQAYWGVKLARELLYTINEGRKHLDTARKRIDEQLRTGQGEATISDQLRLRTSTAEIEARRAEAQKLERVALAGLATLTGLQRGRFDVDSKVIAAIRGEAAPLEHYLDLARQKRPEFTLLKAAVKATAAAAALERARFLPDFLIVATIGYGVATSVDNPQNGFYSDPFNFVRAGFGLALRWNIDPVGQLGKYRAAQAESRRVRAKQAEAMAGMRLELQNNLTNLREAHQRLAAAKSGQKAARRWLVATSQNLDAGLAEPKDLTDALVAFFTMRIRYIRAIFDLNVGWARLGRSVGLAADALRADPARAHKAR